MSSISLGNQSYCCLSKPFPINIKLIYYYQGPFSYLNGLPEPEISQSLMEVPGADSPCQQIEQALGLSPWL